MLSESNLTTDQLQKSTTIVGKHLKSYLERSNQRAETRHDSMAGKILSEEDGSCALILSRLADVVHSLLLTYKESYL